MKHNKFRLEPAELKILFDSFDRSREGWAKYKDFIISLRGYMSDYRRSAAEKLFERLLYNSGKKAMNFDDIRKAYKLDSLGNTDRGAAEQTAADFLNLLSYHQTLWVGSFNPEKS